MASPLERLMQKPFQALNSVLGEEFTFLNQSQRYRATFSPINAEIRVTMATFGKEASQMAVAPLEQFEGDTLKFMSTDDPVMFSEDPARTRNTGPKFGKNRIQAKGLTWRIVRKEVDGANVKMFLQMVN